VIALALGCAMLLAACGDTLQSKPIGASALERVIVKSHFPVYWAGASFAGMQLSSVNIDPSGAVTIAYGNCKVGGQYTCVTPLSIVTSPDNSFVPGGATSLRTVDVRGVSAIASQATRTLAIPTGGVVVSLYANRPSLTASAVRIMAPLNEFGLPLTTLPAATANTGVANVPLPSQVPAGAEVPSVSGQ
jgi:hypothetical protein